MTIFKLDSVESLKSIQLYLSVARGPLQHFDLVTIQGETIKYCVF